jgi:hypothetical protein
MAYGRYVEKYEMCDPNAKKTKIDQIIATEKQNNMILIQIGKSLDTLNNTMYRIEKRQLEAAKRNGEFKIEPKSDGQIIADAISDAIKRLGYK